MNITQELKLKKIILMKTSPIILAMIFAYLLILPAAWGQEEILIIRPLNNNKTSYTEKQVTLEFEISAFEPIDEVKINGEVQTLDGSDWIVIKKTIELNYNRNKIIVEAKAGKAKSKKVFVVFHDPENEELEAKAQRKKTKHVLLAGASSHSNVQQVKDGEGGMKLFAIYIPRLTIKSSTEGKSLVFQGIVSRMKWDNELLKGYETQLTQVTVSQVTNLEGRNRMSVGGGYNYIDWGFGPATGEGHLEDDIFAFFSYKMGMAGSGFNRTYIEYKQQDYEDDASDASVITLKFTLEQDYMGLRGKYKGQYAMTSGKESAIDNNETLLSMEFGIPMGQPDSEVDEDQIEDQIDVAANPWLMSLGLQMKMTDYSESEVGTTLTTYFANASYPLSKGKTLLGEFRNYSLASDIPAMEYENSAITVSMIMNF